jgi:hypothetical protein
MLTLVAELLFLWRRCCRINLKVPESVRALCGSATTGSDAGKDEQYSLPPFAVIYDEIDAHIGGRAFVSVAQMLSDQSQGSRICPCLVW